MRLHPIAFVALVTVLTAGTAIAEPFSFGAIGQTYTEDFNDYRGTEATLPAHMFVTWDTVSIGEDSPYQGVNTGALTAYTSDSVDHAFGIRERLPVDLRDARLYFEFTNNTGQAITGFHIRYDVEAWYVGNRRNRIRLKYDTTLGDGRFETDIFSTDNPSSETTARTAVNGSLPEHRVTVTGFVNLLTLDDGSGSLFGPLAPGETAYFRWQFSNRVEGDDSGSHRSGLAINNLSISPVPEPAGIALLAVGLGVWSAFGLRRRTTRASLRS